MTSLVSDFIINPVLRQARRFSTGFATTDTEPQVQRRFSHESRLEHADVIAEWEEEDMIVSPSSGTLDAIAGLNAHAGRAYEDRTVRTSRDNEALDSSSTEMSSPLGTFSVIDAGTSSLRAPLEVGAGANAQDDSMAIPETFHVHVDGCLPADDGMGDMRKRIFAIQSKVIPTEEKARRMHLLLQEGHTQSKFPGQTPVALRPESPSSPTVFEHPVAASALDSLRFWTSSKAPLPFNLTEDDLTPTYAPWRRPDDSMGSSDDLDEEGRMEDGPLPLGCKHYRRNVKMQCATCEKWYTCRLCHDAVEDHVLPRRETKHMLCMFCGHAQKASDTCTNCSRSAAHYYCNVCKLWNDDVEKNIYHCDDCGICRVGRGLGKDFFHCKKCQACIAVSIETTHKCIERATDSNCPICSDYMFSSPQTVVFMACGHCIHKQCYHEYLKRSYKCPICSKSIVNMEAQFRNIDISIRDQPMPDEYKNTKAIVLCNDCSAKSTTNYHWLGLKCGICHSYNTVQLQLFREQAELDSDRNGQASSSPTLTVTENIELGNPLPDLLTRSALVRANLLPDLEASGPDVLHQGGILDFWGGGSDMDDNESETLDDEHDEEDSDSAEDTEEEDDDQDEDDPITLIGHR